MKNAYRPLAFAVLLSMLCACSMQGEKTGRIRLISGNGIVSSNLPPAEKSEELATAAEDLLTAQGYSEAHEISELALQQDPKNLRAGFIKALTAPLVLQKGILARVRGLAQKHPKSLQALDEAVANLRAQGKDSFADFLLAGESDINTEAQLQSHVDAIIKSLDDLRLFARANRKTELTVKGSTLMVSNMIERYADGCEIKESEQYEYELSCPSPAARFDVTLNSADFAAVQAMASYMKLYFIFLGAYDLTGAADLAAAEADQRTRTAQEIAGELLGQAAFGRLRDQNKLKDVKAMGLDLVRGLNWAIGNQQLLCPKGQNDGRNRPGFWLNTGLCISPYYKPIIEMVGNFSKGEALELKTSTAGGEHVTNHRGVLLFTNPISDVRNIGPLQFNNCNQLTSVGEPTLSGAFPNGDLNDILRLTSFGCEPTTGALAK